MATNLSHGGYGQDAPEGIHQLEYAGGGHPGCGGYVELLEIESIHGAIFLVQEYRSDERHKSWYRWQCFRDGNDARECFQKTWGGKTRNRFTGWMSVPFWAVIPYQDKGVMDLVFTTEVVIPTPA